MSVTTGRRVPIEVTNRVYRRRDGQVCMAWDRIFLFPKRRRRFYAVMSYDSDRHMLVYRLGSTGHLAVELCPRVINGGIKITSARQWIQIGPLRLPLPRWIVGRARFREWQRPDGRLGVRLTVGNPILGPFVGYKGVFDGPLGEAPQASPA